jgi:hypothetical protein
MLSALLRWLGGPPAFRIYGKGVREPAWRIIDVLASRRRNAADGWPILAGTCITVSARLIIVGWDFAADVLREQSACPASRTSPLAVAAGTCDDAARRIAAGAPAAPSASEILAHECGHTYQAARLGPLYLPAGALLTWWREGRFWWNRFENQASEVGLFGGIVAGSAHPDLHARAGTHRPAS